MAERLGISPRIRWIAMALVVVVALTIGSGVVSSAPPTLAERAKILDAQLKCPSCQGLSVTESNSTSAVAVRQEVAAGLAAGKSEATIIAELRSRYGNSVLLTPPDGGLSLVLWIVPAALVGAGVLVSALVIIRRRASAPR
ncbi:MAG: cytochrome c-type biogenesis protein CcmH [Actinomycetes bacterium]